MGSIFKFFIEVKAEIMKVVWPSREETVKYTLVVIAFSIVVASILGAADYALVQILIKVLNK